METKKGTVVLAGLTAVALAVGADRLRADDGCSYRMPAWNQAQVRVDGGYERCGLGLQIFGIGGAILGEKCPRHEIAIPPHTYCVGSDTAALDCVVDHWAVVQRRSCDCDGLVIPLIETGIPTKCVCSDWVEFGQVPVHVAVRCDGPVTGDGAEPGARESGAGSDGRDPRRRPGTE